MKEVYAQSQNNQSSALSFKEAINKIMYAGAKEEKIKSVFTFVKWDDKQSRHCVNYPTSCLTCWDINCRDWKNSIWQDLVETCANCTNYARDKPNRKYLMDKHQEDCSPTRYGCETRWVAIINMTNLEKVVASGLSKGVLLSHLLASGRNSDDSLILEYRLPTRNKKKRELYSDASPLRQRRRRRLAPRKKSKKLADVDNDNDGECLALREKVKNLEKELAEAKRENEEIKKAIEN